MIPIYSYYFNLFSQLFHTVYTDFPFCTWESPHELLAFQSILSQQNRIPLRMKWRHRTHTQITINHVCAKNHRQYLHSSPKGLEKPSLIQMYTRRLPSLKPEAASEALTSSLPWRYFSPEYYGNLCDVSDPFNKNTIYSYAIQILSGVACLLCFHSLLIPTHFYFFDGELERKTEKATRQTKMEQEKSF